jgi:antagonist of KipI
MGIKVIRPGLLTTVQDLGRIGYRKDGINTCGAMDRLALQIGNLLLGNKEEEAGLECTLLGPKLRFEEGQLIALTGGDLSADVDGVSVKMWRPLFVNKGSVLSFGPAKNGCRSYLTVFGGFDLPEVLGSKSTYLKAGFGGLDGRALQIGDTLRFNKIFGNVKQAFNWSLDIRCYPDLANSEIRVLKGPEFDWFTDPDMLFNAPYVITKESDRMGYRLQGPILSVKTPREVLSTAVSYGTLQVTGNGSGILLMADHQTTGGYPRIVQVISADLVKLAQMKAGAQINFKLVKLTDARDALLIREQQLKQLKQTVTFKYL